MLRITIQSHTPEQAVLKLEGRISGEDVALIEQEGIQWFQKTGCLVLDLSGVRFIDQDGIKVLQQWPEHRLILRGASPFVRTMLEAYGWKV